jgi:hypothetical protein
MKTKKAYLILAAVVISFTGMYSFAGANSFEPVVSSGLILVADSADAKIYTCPMHPEVISDEPGECPKCGMDLVLKEADIKQDDAKDEKQDEKKNEKKDEKKESIEHDHNSGHKHGCKH